MDRSNTSTVERRLGGALEPVIGQIYFSPEAHRAYAQLGFAPSDRTANGVELPDGPAYFTSRGSVMGRVRGSVVAAAFAVFNPRAVIPSVDHGWSLTDAATICDARDHGAIGQLERILGVDPVGRNRVEALLVRATDGARVEGRPLAAGITELPDPDHPLGTIFRRGDLLRELRGDNHTIAWAGAGFDAIEIGLMTELYWGLPTRSYTRSRAWADDDFDAAEERLRHRGLFTTEGTLTDTGREAREQVERTTDALMSGVMATLGDDVHELIDLLIPWGVQIREQKGYLASGPHDLAEQNGSAST